MNRSTGSGGGDIKDVVKKFIIDNYLLGSRKVQIKDTDSFLEKGIIDSIGIIELTSFLQRQYAVNIRPVEIVPENCDSLQNIERFITKKLDSKSNGKK